jgi:hypothetical protein
MKIPGVTALLLYLCATSTAFAGFAAGRVNVVSVDSVWNGLLMQLDNPLDANYESQCPFSNWAYMPKSDEVMYKSVLAILTSAKISGEPVTVYTAGCVTAHGQQVPQIRAVDLGVRNGN